MGGQASERTSTLTWYGRLAVWIGAAMLLAQSMRGLGPGLLSVLAVLILTAGFVCFLVGMMVDGGVLTITQSAEPDAAAETAIVPSPDIGQVPARPSASRPRFRERRTKRAQTPKQSQETAPDTASSAASSSVSSEARSWPAPPSPLPGVVATRLLEAGDAVEGQPCAKCHAELRQRDLVVSCPVCLHAHHAVCWMENGFHCGRKACAGAGSLQAAPAGRSVLPADR